MPFHYKEPKIRSGLTAVQAYLIVQQLTHINLEKIIKEMVKAKDLTEAVHQMLYRLSSLLLAELKDINNEIIKVRQVGKLRLNQAIFLPTPKEFKHVYYSTAEVNHRITGNGVIRRM